MREPSLWCKEVKKARIFYDNQNIKQRNKQRDFDHFVIEFCRIISNLAFSAQKQKRRK